MLIVGDNAGLREGIRALVGSQLDMTVAGVAINCEEAIRKFQTLLPDIVIGNVDHPVIWGTESNMRILSKFPQARVIVISAREGREWIRQAYDIGVRAVLYQDMLRAELLSAIRTVHSGQRYIPHAIAMRFEREL